MAKNVAEQIEDAEVDVLLREKSEEDAVEAEKNAPEPEPDIDELELIAAREAVRQAQEGEAPAPAPVDEPEPEPEPELVPPAADVAADTSQADAAPGAQPDQDGGTGHMVPKDRLDQALAAGREAEQKALTEAAYWRGVAAARAVTTQGTEPAAVEKTPEEQVADLRAEQLAVAEKFDNGDINAAEQEKERAALEDKIYSIRSAASAPATPAAAAAPGESLALQQATEQLATQHPYSQQGVLTDADWNFVAAKARDKLAADGTDVSGGTEIDELIWRRTMAEMTTQLGPALAPGYTPPQQQQPSPGNTPAVTDKARQRAANLATAATQPPNTNSVGATDGNLGVTAADIVTMTDEQIAALPQADRDRIRNAT